MPDDVRPLSAEERAEARARHQPRTINLVSPPEYEYCRYCRRNWSWPCDAARALAMCDVLEARAERAEGGLVEALEALRPFAAMVAALPVTRGLESHVAASIRLSDLDRARVVLARQMEFEQ